MKCKTFVRHILHKIPFLIFGIMSVTCEETLPAYVFPQNVLSFQVTGIEQLNDRVAPPTSMVVHIKLVGKNIYDEVFQDSVDVKGAMRIWWKRFPFQYRTLYLDEKNFSDRSLIHDGRLTLVPGQQFSMDVYWNCKTDDSTYLPPKMIEQSLPPLYPKQCGDNVLCGEPEQFIVETTVTIYNRIGVLLAPPGEFTFTPKRCMGCGQPPCPARVCSPG